VISLASRDTKRTRFYNRSRQVPSFQSGDIPSE
jgi:hypothetical protein